MQSTPSHTTGKSAISINGLSHRISSGLATQQILDAVSFEIAYGESIALTGRSGSGKSTLLNLISGLEPFTEGEVRLDGQLINGLNDQQRTEIRARSIGFVHQSFNLIATLSVADNIALPLHIQGRSATQRVQEVRKMAERVGLAAKLDQYPDRLSGGEQQRVAIARALIHHPPIILADEPTGNLDAANGRSVLELLLDLVSQRGCALLLVTHSIEVARQADRVLLLEQAGISTVDQQSLETSVAW